ncbi:MAG: hypothetical protein ABIS50_10170 [Luteolibacter sp.]|uniref:hypothetical protein n=1 Tax=Luteolibacter sp. TaxID=1962973 RepID=UPI0032649F47
MKSHTAILRKIAAIVLILLSIAWIWGAAAPIRYFLVGDREVSVFILAVVPLLILPGALGIFFGIGLYREMSEEAVKGIVGLAAVLGALKISTTLTAVFPRLLPDKVAMPLYLLVGTLIVIPTYVWLVGKLLEMSGHGKPRLSDLLGRGALLLVAWQLFLVLSEVIREYAPLMEGEKYLHEEPWDLLGLLIPIAVAYGFYHITAACMKLPPSGKRRTAAPRVTSGS